MPEKIRSVILEQDPIERQDNVNNILMTHANLSDYLLLYFKHDQEGERAECI